MLNKLAVLKELLDGAGKENCGYLIDAYHFTRSGAGGRGFESVPAEKIFCFQYSDLSPNPVTGVARPTDRLPPGKGVVKWREMLGLLAEKNYTGYLIVDLRRSGHTKRRQPPRGRSAQTPRPDWSFRSRPRP